MSTLVDNTLIKKKKFHVMQVSTDPRLFVLEIGTEELPPNEVVNACKQVHTFPPQNRS